MIHREGNMKDFDQRKAAKDFAERWKDKGYEKGQSQQYWCDLLQNVLGVDDPYSFIEFEDAVHIDKATGFIDAYIPSTKILIEQKSIDKDLRKPVRQADGSLLNPFQQAKRYAPEMGHDRYPRYVVTCNFKSFLVYDMNNPNGEPEEIFLKDLGKEYYRLIFLVDKKNEHIKREEELSFKAGELVGKLYDALSNEYNDISNTQSQKDLNELCVRIVFCLYAEDAGLFGRKNAFHDYLAKYDDLILMRENLIKLFRILDTPLDKRDPYLEEDLNQFPYVNGGLFSNENVEIPKFTDEIRTILLAKASDEFNWSEISPTIFGAVFESTLNPDTRRSGGMHYTSIENIHKVIDPLFLNDIRDMLNEAESYKSEKTRKEKLAEFQKYISSLCFLDPACGSGNFLTETYLALRRLENEALEAMQGQGMITLDVGDQIKVSINQFYGIEINDFAVKVAKTALWIAEAQMYYETKKIISNNTNIDDFLPLETYDNIVEGNALELDWKSVVPSTKCNYCTGNPPFLGGMYMSPIQKAEIRRIFNGVNGEGEFDYVTAWYKKACAYIAGTKIRVAFVSTNSICQGEQVTTFWKHILETYNIEIDFAYNTFVWNSEANEKAKVHCVIIGFSNKGVHKTKLLYTDVNIFKKCQNINPYLIDAPTYFITPRSTPICKVPRMRFGSMPRDGGGFVLTPDERKQIIENYPNTANWIKPYVGAVEFINNKERYCLWLKDVDPYEISKCQPVMERVESIRAFRQSSKAEGTRKFASTPTLFCQIAQPNSNYIIVPKTSSGKRRYLPMGFMDKDTIASDLVFLIPDADLFDFGVLESNVHMAWMRLVAGRLKSDYRYSKDIVYNDFPWPTPTREQKEKIISTGKQILEARKKYPSATLGELYGEKMFLYSDLLKAHQENDKAVMEAYGFNWRKMTESECVAELMKMYQRLVQEEK